MLSTSRLARISRVVVLPVAAVLVAGALAGCSGAGAAQIRVSAAWARPSAMVAGSGGAYMVIENTGGAADALVGGSSPVAATVEVHETYAVEASPGCSTAPMDSGAPSTGSGMPPMGSAAPSGSEGCAPGEGMMAMRPIPRLEIPASGKVELAPGGYHLMLNGLSSELRAGTTIEITLRFEQAGDVKVTAEVRAG